MRAASPRLVFAAVKPAERGFRVVPVYASGASCKDWPNVEAGVDATRERILEHSEADRLAVATGGGFFVVDLARGHGNGADGIAEFARLVIEFASVSRTPLRASESSPAPSRTLARNALRRRASLNPRSIHRGKGASD